MDLKRWKIFHKLDPGFAADVKRTYLIGMNSPTDLNLEDDETVNCPWKGAAMVMKNDDVYSMVSHSRYRRLLGMVEVEDLLPCVPTKIDALRGHEIRAINSGFDYVVILTADGRIYQLGTRYISIDEGVVPKPQFVSGNLEGQRVLEVACGHFHILALTEGGEVYSWGYNGHGQLGTGSKTCEQHPVKISGPDEFDKNILSVACSAVGSFALDKAGNVWSWGDHQFGALGYACLEPQLIPRKIVLNDIKKIVAGSFHMLALSNTNEAYFWGEHNVQSTAVVTPNRIDTRNIVDIGAIPGCSISSFQTGDGKVYFWGFANGHLIPDPVATKFTSMTELFLSLDTPAMLEPLESDWKEPVVEKFGLSFDDKDTGDVKFVVDGKSIYAHKTVLKLSSNYFRGLFTNNWKENNGNENTLEVTKFTYQDFRTFLLYLYTGRIEPPLSTAERAVELFKLADFYGEVDLKLRCENQLEILLTVESACAVYAVAVQHDAKDLHDRVMDFIVPRFNSIFNTEEYQNMADELQKQLIRDMAQENVFDGLKRNKAKK